MESREDKMTIYLIEYNRSTGTVVTLEEFADSRRFEAENSRLVKELDLRRNGLDHEVVLLEAASKSALLKTHRRYFKDVKDIAEAVGT